MKPDRKDLRRLSIRHNFMSMPGDPKAIRDRCPVCGEWTEDLSPRTMRCRRPECKQKLIQRALDIGCARYENGRIIGNIEAAVPYMPNRTETITIGQVSHKIKDLCEDCHLEIKRPKDIYCIECRRRKNAEKSRKKR